MTDHDVQREIEANKQRERVHEDIENDDGTLIDTAERVLDPITDVIGHAEQPDRDDLERQRIENDRIQREGQ